jgi:hypothetical protein
MHLDSAPGEGTRIRALLPMLPPEARQPLADAA